MSVMFRIVLAAMILAPAAAFAGVVCALGSGAAAYKPSTDERPSRDTMQIVRRVDAAYAPFCLPKCREVAMLRNSTAANVMLVVTADEAKLVYSPEFFAGVYSKCGEAAIIALIGHVYGHPIDEVTGSNWIPANWNPELRADGWAGCVLAKTSLTPGGLNSALAVLAMYPPASQPAPKLRGAGGQQRCGSASLTAAVRRRNSTELPAQRKASDHGVGRWCFQSVLASQAHPAAFCFCGDRERAWI